MSARSKDMIGATLIAAGIPMAGEIHLAAGPSTLAFASYWKDWFENDKYHDSTSGIAVGYAALVEGRGDVLLVAPRTDHVISANLSWSKDNTHLVGAGQLYGVRPNATLIPGGAAVTDLLTIDATGCVVSGLTLHNAAATASTACIKTLVTSTNCVGAIVRNCFLWGPDDDTINDATGGWRLIDHSGGGCLFEDLQVGYGYPIAGVPGAASNYPSLLRIRKSLFNDAVFRNCIFAAEFTEAAHTLIMVEFAPSAGAYWVFQNCQFMQLGSTALSLGIMSDLAGVNAAFTGSKNCMYFDANCAFYGVTDVCAPDNEGYIGLSPALLPGTGTGASILAGLAANPDHTA